MANILKIKNEQGEWINVPAIKGDTGPQGPVGPQGPKGDPGEVPQNMVTTDTEQNITAVKTLIGNAQLTFAPNESSTSKWLIGTCYNGINDFKITTSTSSRIGMSFYSPDQSLNQVYIGFNDSAGNDRFKMYIPQTGQTASFYPNNPSWTTDLGQSNNRFTTLYCNKLSDGTTTKTMTEVLAGSTATKKYRHIIRAQASAAPLKNYCFEWISNKSTAYTYNEVDELVSEFENAGLNSLENTLPCIWGYEVDSNNVATNLIAPFVYVSTTNPKHLLYVGCVVQDTSGTSGPYTEAFAISSSNFSDKVIAI